MCAGALPEREGRGKRGGRLQCSIAVAADEAGIAVALDIDGRLMPLPASTLSASFGAQATSRGSSANANASASAAQSIGKVNN